jgi:hypothetical protein
MRFSEIFLDGLKYPLKDLKSFFILGIFLFIPLIFWTIIPLFPNEQYTLLLIIISVIAWIVVSIFSLGYFFSITKNTIEKNENVPRIQPIVNLINGIKLTIVNLVYFIVLSILSIIIFIIPFTFIPSLTSNSAENASNLTENASSLTSNLYQIFSNSTSNLTQIPQNLAAHDNLSNQILPLITSYFNGHAFDLIIICCFILIIILIHLLVPFLYIIGLGIFAETEKLTAFFKFKEIFKKISAIGKLKFLKLVIVTYLISFIIVAIFSIIGLIPIGSISIGVILVIIEIPYILFFKSRIYGLIYNESESNKYEFKSLKNM